jgi:hypothetical protein
MFARTWGLGFWVAMFVKCIVDLGPSGAKPLHHPSHQQDLSTPEWVAYFAIALGLFVVEGLGAFQRSFSPLLVRRARELDGESAWWEIALAPFFVAGLFAATARRLVTSWALIVVLIPGLAIACPYLPYPWRESVDAGVTLGLFWGTLCILVPWFRAARYDQWPKRSADMPAGRPGKLTPLTCPMQVSSPPKAEP